MTIKTRSKHWLSLALITITLFSQSCQKKHVQDDAIPQQYRALSGSDSAIAAADSNFVPFADAEMIAEQITSAVFFGGENKTITRTITSSLVLKDKDNIPVLYVFNYENNEGYVVMSADYRYEPICAFVPQGNLAGSEGVPSAFKGWFATTREIIESIRGGGLTGTIPGNRISWIKLSVGLHLEYLPIGIDRFIREYNMEDCEPFNFSNVNQLVSTTWGQGCTYNDQIPYSCSSTDYCLKAPVGCVATAGATIAHYWSVPSTAFNYNYASMPSMYGNSEVQRLMLNIGQIINMDYGCDGSSANTEDLSDFFGNYLYYTAPGSYDGYQASSIWTVKSDLDAGRPVIMDGCTESANIFNLFDFGSCHAWICDGYKLTTSGCYNGRFHLRMNWGWNGQNNGYFYQSGEWPVDGAYQYSRHFLHNIHP